MGDEAGVTVFDYDACEGIGETGIQEGRFGGGAIEDCDIRRQRHAIAAPVGSGGGVLINAPAIPDGRLPPARYVIRWFIPGNIKPASGIKVGIWIITFI